MTPRKSNDASHLCFPLSGKHSTSNVRFPTQLFSGGNDARCWAARTGSRGNTQCLQVLYRLRRSLRWQKCPRRGRASPHQSNEQLFGTVRQRPNFCSNRSSRRLLVCYGLKRLLPILPPRLGAAFELLNSILPVNAIGPATHSHRSSSKSSSVINCETSRSVRGHNQRAFSNSSFVAFVTLGVRRARIIAGAGK